MSTIVAPSVAVQSPLRVGSPWTGLLRLVWKEYRTVRGFWLMLAGLTVLGQWLTAAIWGRPDTIMLIYNLALGAPVFFAVACAATAFAIEREEGTIEFLRAAPVSAHQVLISKLAIAVTGTVAMFAILMPLARLIAGGQLPNDADWHGMLGLWLVAAIEAIAWGTLFSLLGARPLIAVVLTLVAVSTCDHVLARLNKGPIPGAFEWLAYLRAAPWRGGIAMVVFGADIYLGLRCLDGGVARRGKRQPAIAKRKPGAENATAQLRTESSAQLKPLLAKRDRSTMLGHLLWQQWRQSRWLMVGMACLSIAVPLLGLRFWAFLGHGIPIFSLLFFSTMMGVMAFLPDQEKRYYRYFGEHNVPPRYVWLSRQLPWLLVLLFSASAVCIVWLFAFVNLAELSQEIEILMDPRSTNFTLPYSVDVTIPPLGFGMALACLGYAGGQLMAILLTSGVVAAVLSLILCVVWYAWAAYMYSMHVNFLWSVAPIPIVLLFATWLRTPDWVAESKRWSSRAALMASLAVPASAIFVAVPLYRSHQIPLVAPGFDVARFDSELHSHSAEGRATADLYRKANGLITPFPKDLPDRQSSPTLNEQDRNWLRENASVLRLLVEATSQPVCVFDDPHGQLEGPPLYEQNTLVQLMLLSARQMEADGDLDPALNREFAALTAAARLANGTGFVEWSAGFHQVFRQINLWGARKGQSSKRIAEAIKRVRALDPSILQLDARLEFDYLVALRAAEGDESALQFINIRPSLASELLRRGLMPWEHERAVRLSNLLTHTALHRLKQMPLTPEFRSPGDRRVMIPPLADYCVPRFFDASKYYFQETIDQTWESRDARGEKWLDSTIPGGFRYLGEQGIEAARRLVWFETNRRSTTIILALEQYRIEHGELPKSLKELQGKYLDGVPVDPYSSFDFEYLPKGLTVPQREARIYAFEAESFKQRDSDRRKTQTAPIVPGVSGIWSTGPNIWSSHSLEWPLYFRREGLDRYSYDRPIWLYGDWFPIPEKGD